ncbi:serine hydrolase domain-containing protein [Propionibacteriaceae bacterium Y1685]
MRPEPHHDLVTTQPGLPRTSPEDVGIDPAGILDFLDAVDQELHSVMLLRNGKVAAEGWFSPYEPDRVHLLYSLSKSFCSTAVGFAVAEGLLTLDDRVLDHFGELADVCHPDLQDIRLRHVLSMASGHADDLLSRPEVLASAADEQGRVDLVRALLSTEPQAAPGTLFAYNQPATFTAAAIVQRVTGESLINYLQPRLFAPLGIEPGLWQTDPYGRQIGFSGLHLTTEAIAAFGQFVLQRGRWGDQQLLPSSWFDEATSVQVATPAENNPDWACGYGFQFWIARHGFRGDGAFGQFCVVLPDQDVVLIMTSAMTDLQAPLEAAWEHLLPALDRPAAEGSSETLTARLADLSVDRPALTPLSNRRAGIVRSSIDWISDASIDPQELTLVINDEPWTAPCRANAWQQATWPDGRPVAVIGGTHEEQVWACVALLDAPHRILFTENVDGELIIDWTIPPLGSFNPRTGGGRV